MRGGYTQYTCTALSGLALDRNSGFWILDVNKNCKDVPRSWIKDKENMSNGLQCESSRKGQAPNTKVGGVSKVLLKVFCS